MEGRGGGEAQGVADPKKKKKPFPLSASHFTDWPTSQRNEHHRHRAWYRSYDLLNIFAKKLGKEIGVFVSKQS
jgi:hypothetical protein